MNLLKGAARQFIGAFALAAFAAGGAFAQVRTAGKAGSAELLLSEAAAALSSDNLPTAKAKSLQAAKAAPSSPAAQTLLGIIADRENDLASAERHFAAAARLSPMDPETRNNYGAILLRKGSKKRAADEFAASLAINPGHLSALINLGQIRFEEGDLRSAKGLFERARSINQDAEIQRALLVIALKLKDTAGAAAEYRTFAAAAKPEQLSKGSRLELGASLLAAGLLDEAETEFKAVSGAEPSNVEGLVGLARVYSARKDIRSAGRTLEAAVARGIDDAKIYAALAEVYKAGGYLENAIPAMRLATEKDPANADHRFRYAMLLTESKAPGAAIVRLKEAIQRFPNSSKLWLALGIAHYELRQSPEAEPALKKALELEPGMLPAIVYLGSVYSDTAKYQAAAAAFERAVQITAGKHGGINYLLAETLMNIEGVDQRRIEALLKQATALDPKLASAHTALGNLYTRQEKLTDAAAAFERSLVLEPDNTKALYPLSRVYARLKMTDKWQATLDRFKRATTEEKERKETENAGLLRRLANVQY